MTAPPPYVVIYANGPSSPQDATPVPVRTSGEIAARPARIDPDRLLAAFPILWGRFIRANFHNLRQVMLAFGVSERTARSWWAGDGGCNGRHVFIAMGLYPRQLAQMLQEAA